MNDMLNETDIHYLMKDGNLTEMANNTAGSNAIFILTTIWTAWLVVSMLVSWQNSEWTGTYDPPITYIWTLTGANDVTSSVLPLGYLLSWIINFVLFTIEWVAVLVNGDFYATWVYVGLWGGLTVGALPWILMLVYIFEEYPKRNSGQAWNFIFWSAEFWMILGQGSLWLISLLVHIFSVRGVWNMIKAR